MALIPSLARSFLPRANFSRDDPKQGMWLWRVDTMQLPGHHWSSHFELPFQMRPFICQLSAGLANLLCSMRRRNLLNVEVVTAPRRFGGDLMQKGRNR